MRGPVAGQAALVVDLPPDLRLRVIGSLPPHVLALTGRLVCRGAGQHFCEPHHHTTSVSDLLSNPLPSHYANSAPYIERATEALGALTFRQKLLLPVLAATSGCEANVSFALQLLEPSLFPELLHTSHYRKVLLHDQRSHDLPLPDMGSTAVASGLAHMLPFLEQHCSWLLDPARTLEAAARQCDLGGLQVA